MLILASCVDINEMWEITGKPNKWWRENIFTYTKIDIKRQTLFTTEESAPAKTTEAAPQTVIYHSSKVHLNIHLATLFCPAFRLLLICFFLYSHQWCGHNPFSMDVREDLTWLLFLLQPVCLRQLLTSVRDRRKHKKRHYFITKEMAWTSIINLIHVRTSCYRCSPFPLKNTRLPSSLFTLHVFLFVVNNSGNDGRCVSNIVFLNWFGL